MDPSSRAVVQRLFLAVTVLAGPASTATAGEVPACPADARWGLVIDAGSSGSRLHLYCWRPAEEDGLPWIEDRGSQKLEPGLGGARCSHTPEQATDTLRPLLAMARETVGDEATMARTPLALLATGGLRQCSPESRARVLAAVREELSSTPFDVVAVEVLSGEDEGRLGWMSVNYLARRDGGGEPSTVGALDLGGTSTQITFAPQECPAERPGCGELDFGGAAYSLYSHSYQGWGQDLAMESAGSPACSLRGYQPPDRDAPGRGRYRACRKAIRRTIARKIRRDPPRPRCADSCTRLGAYQPPVRGDFVAFSAYAYTTDFFGLTTPLALTELEAAGRDYCRTPWAQIEAECAAGRRRECDADRLNRYCFASAYIVTLLHEIYGFPMDTRAITSSNELGGAEVGWTLGAMVRMAEGAGW